MSWFGQQLALLDIPASQVAVKCIHSSGSQDADSDNVRREIKIWARLQNEHIVPLIGLVYGISSSPALVSPWIEQGSLKKFLRSHHKTLTPYERFRLVSYLRL
jgi:serine/threonine protein kinase